MANVKLALRKDADLVDEVAIERYLKGRYVGRQLTYAERAAVARREHEHLVGVLARRFHVPEDDVRAWVAVPEPEEDEELPAAA